ncbi:hypothetical protein ACTXT7_017339 [Hymenolepis weldensis]
MDACSIAREEQVNKKVSHLQTCQNPPKYSAIGSGVTAQEESIILSDDSNRDGKSIHNRCWMKNKVSSKVLPTVAASQNPRLMGWDTAQRSHSTTDLIVLNVDSNGQLPDSSCKKTKEAWQNELQNHPTSSRDAGE